MRTRSVTSLWLVAVLVWCSSANGVEPEHSCADLNEDGVINVADPVCLLCWLFMGGPALGCAQAGAESCGDVNTDDVVDMEDAVDILNWLFLGAFDLACPASCEGGAIEIEGFTFVGCNPQGYPEYTHDQTGIIFVRLPGGTFNMGAPHDDPFRESDEGPVHRVTLSPFLMGKYEVTQGQWEQVMGENRGYFGPNGHGAFLVPPEVDSDNLPVEFVSWPHIQEFEEKTGLMLPTEAQWEYAARAGTEGAFSFGSGESCANWVGCLGCDEFDAFMWYCGNSEDRTHEVGTKPANPFGLHEMHGNVWEWVEDVWNGDFYAMPEAAGPDPVFFTSGADRLRKVRRGGSWLDDPSRCRSAIRSFRSQFEGGYDIGFRPAVWPIPESPAK